MAYDPQTLYGQNSWTSATKIFDPISNRIIQNAFIQTMIAEHPLFAAYYDPANINIDGGVAEYIGGQMAKGSPKRWKRGFSRADWPHSDSFRQRLTLVEYGLFGDMTSHDFGKLAFKAPDILAQVFDSKIEIVIQQWKRNVENHILYNLCDKAAYGEGGFEELPKDYFKIETDPKKTLECQAKALNFIAKIETRAYKFLDYSRKYNKEGHEAVVPSLKDLILALDPSANTFLNIYGYSSAYNVGYLDLKQKFGKVIVKKLGSYEEGEHIYEQFKSDGELDKTAGVAVKGRHTYNWKALLHDKNFYKVHEAINHPGNEDVFIDSKDYSIDLTSYVGKWWFCFEGCIRYVNASAWVQTDLDSDEIKSAKPTKEDRAADRKVKKTAKIVTNTALKASQDAVLGGFALNNDGAPTETPSTTKSVLILSNNDRYDVRETKSIKELQALLDKVRNNKTNQDYRLAGAIKKVNAHFLSKSADKNVNGKLGGTGKGKDKTLNDILGKDWKSREKSFPIATIKTQANFDTAVKALTDKIDEELKT